MWVAWMKQVIIVAKPEGLQSRFKHLAVSEDDLDDRKNLFKVQFYKIQ